MTVLTPSKVGKAAASAHQSAIPEPSKKPAPPQAYLSSSVPMYMISVTRAFIPDVT